MEPPYNTNREYRNEIRKFFTMDLSKVSKENALLYNDDLDSETEDELLYDEISSEKNLNAILERTLEQPIFQEIYDIAAAKFFSTDRGTGLTVLLCYDYFYLFRGLLADFDKDKTKFSKELVSFKLLKEKL